MVPYTNNNVIANVQMVTRAPISMSAILKRNHMSQYRNHKKNYLQG